MKTKTDLTICGYLLDKLKKEGLKNIFASPGDHVSQFDKTLESHQLKLINAANQHSCGFMADAYARLTGLGCLFTTYGVAINAVNAIAQSYSESSPVVVISSSNQNPDFAKIHQTQNLFQQNRILKRDKTQLDIFKKITVYQTIIENSREAAQKIDVAIDKCGFYRKPVYIEIPVDLMDSKIGKKQPIHPPVAIPQSNEEARNELILEVAEMLKNCNRPVIWLGHQIRSYDLYNPILKFAERFNIPIVTTLLAKTVISEFHPLLLGVYQGELTVPLVKDYVENADMALILGLQLNDINSRGMVAKLEQDQKVVANTKTIAAKHHYYDDVSFYDFVKKLSSLDLNVRFKGDYPSLIDRKGGRYPTGKEQRLTISSFFDILQNYLDPNHIVVTDIGDALFGSIDLQLDRGSFLSNTYYSTLGFGLSGAIGAAIARPEKRVIAIIGDGAFQMSGLELTTCLKYRLDPIIVILNNHGFTTERTFAEGKFNAIANWNYAKIPEVIGGGKGYRVKKEGQLAKALEEAFAKRGRLNLLEVDLKRGDFSQALKSFFIP